MDLAFLDGIQLEYENFGTGDAVVLIHPGIFADWFRPLLKEPAIADHYRALNYHRVGNSGSSHLAGPVSIADHAVHCRRLMNHLGIQRAHVVGHSSSGNVALQLALEAPEMVQSLALLEPAIFSIRSAQAPRPFVQAALDLYHAGDKASAIDAFLRGVCGPDYRAILERVLPGAFDQYAADADTFFGQEQPAMQQWSFTQQDAHRITQPVLAVIGELSLRNSPITVERQDLLLSWLPNVEAYVLPDAGHLMQVQNPKGMAECLSTFFANHPLSSRA